MKTLEVNRLEGRRIKRFEQTYEREPEQSGLFDSIKRVLATSLAAFESRIELLTLELKEVKGRAFGLIFWGATLVFLAFLTLVAIMGAVLFLMWENALQVLIGFSAFFLVAAIASFLVAQSKVKKIPFCETVDQLKKDRALATNNNHS